MLYARFEVHTCFAVMCKHGLVEAQGGDEIPCVMLEGVDHRRIMAKHRAVVLLSTSI